MVEVFDPASSRNNSAGLGSSLYSLGADQTENTASTSTHISGSCRRNVFTEPLALSGRLLWLHYYSKCHVTSNKAKSISYLYWHIIHSSYTYQKTTEILKKIDLCFISSRFQLFFDKYKKNG
jgi:hypothetical protein